MHKTEQHYFYTKMLVFAGTAPSQESGLKTRFTSKWRHRYDLLSKHSALQLFLVRLPSGSFVSVWFLTGLRERSHEGVLQNVSKNHFLSHLIQRSLHPLFVSQQIRMSSRRKRNRNTALIEEACSWRMQHFHMTVLNLARRVRF